MSSPFRVKLIKNTTFRHNLVKQQNMNKKIFKIVSLKDILERQLTFHSLQEILGTM